MEASETRTQSDVPNHQHRVSRSSNDNPTSPHRSRSTSPVTISSPDVDSQDLKLQKVEQQQQRQQVSLMKQDNELQAPLQQQQTNSDNSDKPKRNPFCSRCRNHGKSAQVKGHKRHCEYRDCQCEGCKLVECRQLVSAAQIRRRRYQKQDEECGRRIEISPPVLKREPHSDPAALIAKTLIGSSKLSGQQHNNINVNTNNNNNSHNNQHHHIPSHAAAKHLSLIGGAGHHHHHYHQLPGAQHQLAAAAAAAAAAAGELPMGMSPATAAATLAAAAAASSASSVLANPFAGHAHPHHLLATSAVGLGCTNGNQNGIVSATNLSPTSAAAVTVTATTATTTTTTDSHSSSISPQSTSQQPHLHHQRARDMSSPTMFNNSLHLFQFPGPMLTDTAAVAAAATAASPYSLPLGSTLNPLPTTPATQSLLWPSLKLAPGVVTNPGIHPHHLLTPFIHHPFLAAQHHHHQHQPNTSHYQHHQVSSPSSSSSSMMTAPTPAAPASSKEDKRFCFIDSSEI